MPTQRIQIDNSRGHSLAALLDLPEHGEPHCYALFAHCFTCGKNLKAAVKVARALADQGIAVLRFDFTGLGQSEGEFSETSFSTNSVDLLAAAEHLAREYEAPRILIGHSLGGAAVLHAAASIPSVVAIATIGAPFDPAHVAHLFDGARAQILEEGVATVKLAGRPFRIGKGFLDDLEQTDPSRVIGGLRRALLVLHAPLDDTVGIDNARLIYQAAKHPKSFVSLDGADHLLTADRDSAFAASMIATWAERYAHEEVETVRPSRLEARGHDVVARIGATGFRTELLASGHRMVADEPAKVGGTETGPTPYDLLLAGLGACSAMTMRMYAERKGWPFEGATVRLSHNKIHAADCEDCESDSGRIDHIEREIELHGPLDEAQRKRILAIADKCPVHRTMHAEVKVRSRLTD